jgi:hypothetical protein
MRTLGAIFAGLIGGIVGAVVLSSAIASID